MTQRKNETREQFLKRRRDAARKWNASPKGKATAARWRAKHRVEERERSKAYYYGNLAAVRKRRSDQMRARRAANPEAVRAYYRDYYLKNRDHIIALRRASRKAKREHDAVSAI